MKLIKKLGTKIDKYGHKESWGLFLCPYCLKEVEKYLSGGKKQKSCGCNKYYKHGDTHTKLHTMWKGMKQRCLNLNHKFYKYYGGRGITICPEWTDKENGYINFRGWALVNGYKEGLEIDRINNNSNYEPGNCRWVTHKENSKNRRFKKLSKEQRIKIRKLYAIGKYAQQELAEMFDVSQRTISYIIRIN